MSSFLILTCEHASNAIPANYQPLFADHEDLLQQHFGWDIGAVDVFYRLQSRLNCLGFVGEWSRLLFELNRSLGHKKLFSDISKQLPLHERDQLLNLYYHPYRNEVIKQIQQAISQDQSVIHLSIHSFTPVLNGEIRQTDIGLLYHPQHANEKLFAKIWKQQFAQQASQIRVRMNYPYSGVSDGFVPHLRTLFSADKYLGIELEMNQKYLSHEGPEKESFTNKVIETCLLALQAYQLGRV